MEKETCPSHKPQDLGLSNRKGAQRLPGACPVQQALIQCLLYASSLLTMLRHLRYLPGGQLQIKLGKWTCKQIVSTGNRKGNRLEWLQPEEGPGGDQEGFLGAVTLESLMRSWD